MSRLVRLVDESDPSEEVMVLGGERGVVTLHLPGGCRPTAMNVHSPVQLPGFSGPNPCARLEMTCWYASSISAPALAGLLAFCREDASAEEHFWHAMKSAYSAFLAGVITR